MTSWSRWYFNPRPPAEGDVRLPHRRRNIGISIHALPRRATASPYCFTSALRFQSTPSRGGRPARHCQALLVEVISIHALPRRATLCGMVSCGAEFHFNPRPPAEGDRARRSGRYPRKADFNPRPPAEGDSRTQSPGSWWADFNPRPPAEGDLFANQTSIDFDISIHALPRRATWKELQAFLKELKFQSTPSRGGRRSATISSTRAAAISIHALPRRATIHN